MSGRSTTFPASRVFAEMTFARATSSTVFGLSTIRGSSSTTRITRLRRLEPFTTFPRRRDTPTTPKMFVPSDSSEIAAAGTSQPARAAARPCAHPLPVSDGKRTSHRQPAFKGHPGALAQHRRSSSVRHRSTPIATCATGRATNHVGIRTSIAGGTGCSLMGGLPAMHVNTTLTILISALYADARFCRASSAHTKRQARERAARCASSSIRGGGIERDRTCKQLHRRRTMPKHAS
jgi:hypothetical protein